MHTNTGMYEIIEMYKHEDQRRGWNEMYSMRCTNTRMIKTMME